MKMSRLGLARPRELSCNFKQSGNPENCRDLLVDTERMGIAWNQLEAKTQDRETLKVSRRSTAYTPGGVIGLSK